MASKFRTMDNRSVGFGDLVWSQNGDGPFRIAPLPRDGQGYFQLIEVGGPGVRIHAPEDITLYYCASKPS
jgi:hypothetical protein